MRSLLKSIQKKIITTISEQFLKFRATEHTFMILVAIVIGFGGGLGAVGIQYLIKLFQELFWGDWNLDLEYLNSVPVYVKVLAPTIGGFFVGLIVFLVAKEAKGHGVPEVMEAIALRNGLIRARVVFAKLLASAICIGSGGSTGREGPVIQIGASVGSTIGQFLRVNPERMKIFVGCGAAAGIAAVFNAPVAGALFSLEIILGDFGVAQFGPIVIASVVATVVSRWFLGNNPAFEVPEYNLVSPVELIPYAILGIIAGLVALMFIKTLYSIEDYFEKLKLHDIIKTMLGGLMIGIMGIFVPHIYGVGYNSMDLALLGELPWMLMLGLIFFKIFATSLSLGSGGSGGIFAPSLFLGTMTGGFFGALVHKVIPDHSATSGAYSLVGMGAVVAGATHAPITAILIIFEMTGDYAIILPLMISAIIATVLTTKLKKESIYTLKLIRRGVDLFRGREVNILKALTVAHIMNKKPVIIRPDLNFTELLELVVSQPNTHFFVVNQENELVGAVSWQDVRSVLLDQDYITDWLIAMDLVNPNITWVEASYDLGSVMKLFGLYDIEEIPVVDSVDKKHIIGSVEQKDIINIYNKELVKKNLSQEFSRSLKLLDKIQTVDFIDDYMMTELPIPASFIGKSIKEIDIRAKYGVQILMIKKKTESGDYKQIVPSPGEKLVKEDFLVIMAKNKDIENFKHVS
ncbi:MAG: CBS domain-containing protein [Calditrichae bacterium]|nr:CBS domain-containing protein [Calditrichia bacterium]